jgi:hypothetical protein
MRERELGLDPGHGGKRSDVARLKDRMTRLFRARISFDSTADVPGGGEVDRWVTLR